MHPPFPFRLRRKGNGPCTVQRKRRFGAKRHGVPYLLMIRGSQQETLGGRIGVSVGRGPSSSQSPYPSLSAYAESSLIPTLVLSPRKPLRWVFAGAPVLLKFSAVRPRRTAFVRRRVQDRFDLLLPAAAALPTSNRSSATSQAALSEAGSAEREGRPFDDHPRKQHPRPQLRGNTLSVPKDPGAPGRSLPNYGGTDSLDPRFAQT